MKGLMRPFLLTSLCYIVPINYTKRIGSEKEEGVGDLFHGEKRGSLSAKNQTACWVLWPECGWQPVSLIDLITAAAVKKVYKKATLSIHPDKVQQKGANLQQKYVAEKVFDLLKLSLQSINPAKESLPVINGINFGDGFVELIVASQTTGEAGMKWFEGTTDVVRQFTWVFEDAKNRNIENILILYKDHLFRMNYMDFVQIDGRGQVFHFAEKPKGSELRQMDADSVPIPVVLIDQDSDSDATIVQLSFGDRLGALIDTMNALKDLGLDVAKGTVLTEGPVKQTKFFITRLDSGRKVEDPDMLERIRLTIINNLLKYHPESSERLAMGEAFGIKAPEKKLDVDIATRVHVKEDGPKRSLLCIETADRPGLLVEIIKVIADVNIDVESAEIDTEGLIAKDKFHVSYRGASLNSSLSQVLVNCLRFYLGRPETDTDSY